jgi:hypothetical protein
MPGHPFANVENRRCTFLPKKANSQKDRKCEEQSDTAKRRVRLSNFQGVRRSISPRFRPMVTAWALSLAPSFESMFVTWLLTVASPIES